MIDLNGNVAAVTGAAGGICGQDILVNNAGIEQTCVLEIITVISLIGTLGLGV